MRRDVYTRTEADAGAFERAHNTEPADHPDPWELTDGWDGTTSAPSTPALEALLARQREQIDRARVRQWFNEEMRARRCA